MCLALPRPVYRSRKAIKALLSRHSYRLIRRLLYAGTYGLNGIDKRLIEIVQQLSLAASLRMEWVADRAQPG